MIIYLLIHPSAGIVKPVFYDRISAKKHLTHASNKKATNEEINEKWVYFENKGWQINEVNLVEPKLKPNYTYPKLSDIA